MFGVMIGLGILTYTLVFNLNNLTQAVYQQYEKVKLPWTREMEKDGGIWKDRAIRYHGFSIKRFDTSPSNWLLIWYIITWPARRFLTPKTTSSIAQEEKVPQHPTERRDKSKGVDDPNDGGWLNDHPPFPPWEDSKCLIPAALRAHFICAPPHCLSSTTSRSAILVTWKHPTGES